MLKQTGVKKNIVVFSGIINIKGTVARNVTVFCDGLVLCYKYETHLRRKLFKRIII
jgi:hypothetical protein